MELAKIRKIAGKEEIMALCERFGLAEHIHKKYGKYSLGMKQKMRLIQAFMEKPDILILDEPFDALDKTSREILVNYLEEFMSGPHHTLIYTSQSPEFEDLADIIYEIDDHKLVEHVKVR